MYQKSVCSLITIVLILLSCTSIRQELIRKPGIGFEGAELKDMSLFEATALFRFRITNSNPMGLNIRNIVYDLRLNGRKFIRGISDKDLRVRSAGEGLLELPIVIHYDDMIENFENTSETGKIGYDLSGTMDVGPFTLPYQNKNSLNLPKLPKLSLKTIRISELSNTYASVIFEIDIENPNSFGVAIKRMDYSVKLAGKDLSEGFVGNISMLAPKSISRLEIPSKVSFLKTDYSFSDILKESSGVYEISGEMTFDDPKIGEKKLGFRRAGSVPLVR